MDDVQSRVQNAVDKMINNLDKECLRTMQKEMHLCSVRCCDNEMMTMNDVQSCIERCSQPLLQAQQVVQNELQNYQDRLQRCAMDCRDKSRDKFAPGMKEDAIAQCRSDMEACVTSCADSHVKMIPSLTKRIQEGLRAQHL